MKSESKFAYPKHSINPVEYKGMMKPLACSNKYVLMRGRPMEEQSSHCRIVAVMVILSIRGGWQARALACW
jgi:hypothetical protein